MRTKKILINVICDVIPYILIGIVGLLKVKYLINYIGDIGNGYYQFINQIISYVFLAQIGFNAAVTYKLYKPFALKNYDDINAIYSGSRKIFKRIALVIFGIIVVTTCGLYIFGNITDGYQSSVLICFFVISSSYLIAYVGRTQTYSAMLDANQDKYVYSLVLNGMKLLCDILIIMVTIWFRSLEAIAVVILIIKIIEEFVMRIVVSKKYPWIHEVSKKDTSMLKMTKDLAWLQVGYLVLNNIDAVLIMLVLGPIWVSIYTSYNFIMRFLNEITTRISNVILYSFGNVFVKDDRKHAYNLFKELMVLFIIISFSISFTFILGIRGFMNVWINDIAYLLSYRTIVLFALTMFLTIIYLPLVSITNANGLFKDNKKHVFICALINIVLSIILIYILGINGVLIGTCAAFIINIILKIDLISKKVFNSIKKRNIYLLYFYMFITFIVSSILFKYLEINLLSIIGSNIMVCILMLGIIFILLFGLILLMSYVINKNYTSNLLVRLKKIVKKG